MSRPRTPSRAPHIGVFLALLLGSVLVAHARSDLRDAAGPQPPAASAPPIGPRIDLVFALDTTGSMTGLIEGAKQKIWTVASELMDARPAPRIRIGLVAYRDRGDAYVTRRLDLTDDIDAVWAELRSLSAAGGGDGPESVNRALHEAVTRLDWSPGPEVFKVVFLVGDAPPHTDYPDEPRTAEITARARAAGIVVNTIQCGSLPDTAVVWKRIAADGGGEFAAIAQDGAMLALESPVDAELGRLQRALAETLVPYGSEAQREEVRVKQRLAGSAAPSVAADRLSYLAKATDGDRANLGRRDLVDAAKEGLVDVESLPEQELPASLRALAPERRGAWLEERGAKRDALQARVAELVEERDRWVREERERRAAEGGGDAFDAEVLGTLRRQAAGKGLRWE